MAYHIFSLYEMAWKLLHAAHISLESHSQQRSLLSALSCTLHARVFLTCSEVTEIISMTNS